MKKLAVLFISFFVVFSITFAQQTDLGVSAGLAPDSVFYFFDGVGEWVNLRLTFNKAKKAEKRLNYASERLAELEKIKGKGELDQEKAEKLKNKYASLTAGANDDLSQLKSAGKDVTELVKKMEDISARHNAVLEKVLEKVPEQARDAIQKALEMSKRGHEMAIEAIKKEAEEGNIKLEELKEEVKKEVKKRSEKIRKQEEEEKESEQEEESSEMEEIEKEQEEVESMMKDIERDNLKSATSEVDTLEQSINE